MPDLYEGVTTLEGGYDESVGGSNKLVVRIVTHLCSLRSGCGVGATSRTRAIRFTLEQSLDNFKRTFPIITVAGVENKNDTSLSIFGSFITV